MTARRPAATAVKNVSGNESRQCGGARAAALRLAVAVAKNVGGYDPTERDGRRGGERDVTTSPKLLNSSSLLSDKDLRCDLFGVFNQTILLVIFRFHSVPGFVEFPMTELRAWVRVRLSDVPMSLPLLSNSGGVRLVVVPEIGPF